MIRAIGGDVAFLSRRRGVLWPVAMARIASVLLPLPLPEAFDYAEPEGMDLQVGDQVVAPLGPRRWIGVVSALRDGEGHNRPLKPILELRQEARLPPGTLAFLQWAAPRYAVGVTSNTPIRTVETVRPRPRHRPARLRYAHGGGVIFGRRTRRGSWYVRTGAVG